MSLSFNYISITRIALLKENVRAYKGKWKKAKQIMFNSAAMFYYWLIMKNNNGLLEQQLASNQSQQSLTNGSTQNIGVKKDNQKQTTLTASKSQVRIFFLLRKTKVLSFGCRQPLQMHHIRLSTTFHYFLHNLIILTVVHKPRVLPTTLVLVLIHANVVHPST